jgi:hypothetical protein
MVTLVSYSNVCKEANLGSKRVHEDVPPLHSYILRNTKEKRRVSARSIMLHTSTVTTISKMYIQEIAVKSKA